MLHKKMIFQNIRYMRLVFLFSMLVCLLSLNVPAQLAGPFPGTMRHTDNPRAVAKVTVHQDTPQLGTFFEWRDSLSDWDTTGQAIYTYYNDGKLAEEINYMYANQSFLPVNRSVYTYDSMGLTQEWTMQTWGGQWDNFSKVNYTYDPFGNTTDYVEYNWLASAWDTAVCTRNSYTYHNVSQIASVTRRIWQGASLGYRIQDSTDHHFDLSNRWDTTTFYYANANVLIPETRIVDYVWHDFSKQQPSSGRIEKFTTSWVDDRRFTATYSQNDSELWIYEKFVAPSWVNYGKESVTYDIEDHPVAIEYYGWIGAWELEQGELNTYVYNGNGQTLSRVRELFDGYLFRFDRKYVYSAFFTQATEATLPVVQVRAYPNPATESIQFQLALDKPIAVTVQLLDMQGTLRTAATFNRAQNEITLPISDVLENGTYIYRITTATGQASGKIVVQR